MFVSWFVQLPLYGREEEEELVARGVQSRSRTELWLRVCVQFANRSILQLKVGYA